MKSFNFLSTLVFVLAVSCSKDTTSTFWELPLNSNDLTIEENLEDILFSFFLLDENGNPATTFEEGKNFSFHFSVKNNRNEDLYFFPDFAYSQENEFCKIFSAIGTDLGKPFVFRGYNKIGIGAYPLKKGESYTFQQSWIDNREEQWQWMYGYYESIHQDALPLGNYHTKFKHQFKFDRMVDKPPLNIGTVEFKINFKIQ